MKADLRLFYKWLKGIHGDHANNEKAVCSDLDGKKTDSAIVDLGVTAALEMNAQEVLRISEAWQKQKIEDAGGQEAWDQLSAEERSVRDLAALDGMYRSLGLEQFEKMDAAEKQELTLFFWVGCCMHKDMNAFKGGNTRMMVAYEKLGLPPPVMLANKQNAALLQRILDPAKKPPENGELTETEMTALEASTRGGVKTCALAGALFNHKDDKKGQQDTHQMYFSTCYGDENYRRFPDTSNDRFGTYGEAASELVSDLPNYRAFLKHIHDAKARPGWTNMELNLHHALSDIPTVTELVVMSLYSQLICRPYLTHVQADEEMNTLDLGPFHKETIKHVETLIKNPDLVLADNASPKTAVLKGMDGMGSCGYERHPRHEAGTTSPLRALR